MPPHTSRKYAVKALKHSSQAKANSAKGLPGRCTRGQLEACAAREPSATSAAASSSGPAFVVNEELRGQDVAGCSAPAGPPEAACQDAGSPAYVAAPPAPQAATVVEALLPSQGDSAIAAEAPSLSRPPSTPQRVSIATPRSAAAALPAAGGGHHPALTDPSDDDMVTEESAEAPFRGPLARLASYLEARVDRYLHGNSAYLVTGIAAGRFADGFDTLQAYSSWEALQRGLLQLGFDLASSCPWTRLGIARLEGAPPDEKLVADQATLVANLLQLSASTSWGAAAAVRGAVLTALGCVSEAAAACVADLPQALRDRRALGFDKAGWTTWLESEALLDDWLLDYLPEGTCLLTRLSNVQGLEFPRDGVYSPEGARQALAPLLGPPGGPGTTWLVCRPRVGYVGVRMPVMM